MSAISSKKKRNLTVFFVVSIALIITVLNSFQILYIAHSTKESSTSDYEENCNRIQESYSKLLTKQIDSYSKQLIAYTGSDIAQTGDTEKIVSWMKSHTSLHSADFQYIAWCGPDGKLYTDTGMTADVKDRSYFNNIISKGYIQDVDNPVLSKINGKCIIHISRAVKVNTKTIGFFTGIVSIETIQNLVNSIKLGSTGYAWLMADDGTVIAYKERDVEFTKNFLKDFSSDHTDLKTVAEAVSKGQTGSAWIREYSAAAEKKNQKSDSVYVVYSPVAGTSWGFVFSVSENQILASSKRMSALMIVIGLLIDIFISVFVGLFVYHTLKPLKEVKKTITSIASGNADLTQRITVSSNDDIGSVVEGFNTFTEKLHDIMSILKKSKDTLIHAGTSLHQGTEDTAASITQILANIDSVRNQITNQASSVEETAGAVNEIASNIGSLEKMIETQSAGVTQASAAIEEMIGNINSVNNSVEKMAQSFNELQAHIQNGVSKQQDINERIVEIANQSDMLKEANDAISNIAQQTNLLAMNAAIEAAHAGEAGKGFSVVADEIRKLSETSTQQSKTIGNELKKVEQSINDVVSVSTESKEVFTTVSLKIKDTHDLVTQIKSAMQEQKEGSRQINEALHDMNDSTAEVRDASSEMSAGNKAILDEIKRLQDATMVMKDSVNEMTQGARKINETGTSLSEISNNMETTITSIGSQIDLFKV